MKDLSYPAVTHLIKDPIGALGADSVGSVAQAMAGPEVDEAIAKQLDMINNNPASATADEGIENLKDVHSKIKRYLGKLNQLYATPPVPNGETPSNAPKQSVETTEATNTTSDESESNEENEEGETPNLQLPELRKAVLTAAIKKAASSALEAANSKIKQGLAAEEARHTAAVQNLTSIALKEKAALMTARWRVSQAVKTKTKAREALTKLQTHEMKTKMAISTLQEHENSVKADIEESSKALDLTKENLKDRIKAYRDQKKVFDEAQDTLLEEKASQIQELFEQQASGTGNKDASLDSKSMERFLSARQ
jgi:chemotaxis protein histidine kinase CheA